MTGNGNGERISYKGRYVYGVDAKRRIQIPAKWRPKSDFVYSIYLWRDPVQKKFCLMVLPPWTAEKLENRLMEMPFGDPNAESLRRLLGSNSDDVVPDRAGRICIPEPLVEKAELPAKVLLLGCLNSFQIWNPTAYKPVETADWVHEPEARNMI